jgi:ligand-binding sensor domain-containing protein
VLTSAVLFSWTLLFASPAVAQEKLPTTHITNQPLAPGEMLAKLADFNFEVMGVKQGLPHDSVYGMTQDKRGFLWIATFGGLARFDGYQLRNYLHDPSNPSSLPDNNIRLVLPRASGGLWIATGNAGVISYNSETDSFHPLPHLPATLRRSHVFCMTEDNQGGVWFGSQLGLVHYTPQTQSYEVLGKAAGKANPPDFTLGSVFSVLIDTQGNL